MAAFSPRKIARYAILPGYWPRLKALFGGGFSTIAVSMAVVYRAMRLLPANHPYLDPANAGRFGIRHVIAQAADNLVFSRKNIDQIIVFFTMLFGIVILALQFVMLLLNLIPHEAFAAGVQGLAPMIDWFSTPSHNMPYGPSQDLAFVTLDRVFGMQGIFNSCIAQGIACKDIHGSALTSSIPAYPYPMHLALHQMMTFYSFGIGIISIIIILYFVIVLVTETIMTGSPFGQRATMAWMPLRLIVFFALLAPINMTSGHNDGINGAQYITFLAAKWGSNFASNGWGRFNEVLTGSYLGNETDLVAEPNIPEITTMTQFFFVAKMCQIGEKVLNDQDVRAYLVRNTLTGVPYAEMSGTDFTKAREFAQNGTITIRYGVMDKTKYALEKGNVKPLCGELAMTVNDAREVGSLGIMEDYYTMIGDLWKDPDFADYAGCVLSRISVVSDSTVCNEVPSTDFTASFLDQYNQRTAKSVHARIQEQIDNGDWTVPPALLEKGWAGAAIWYNRIAQMNGAVTTAVFNLPQPTLYPDVMEITARQHASEDEHMSGADRFNPLMADNQLVKFNTQSDQYLETALYSGFNFWASDGVKPGLKDNKTGNVVIDTINKIYGISGLFSMRHNASVHPLAQLSSIGKSLIEAAIRNTLISVGVALSDKFFDMFSIEPAMSGLSAFMQSTISITLVIGVVLYFVLPLMPAIYFLFAVGGWIRAIFEAIVAMPLWALAHITRIDGDGLPGPAATNGYFLIFEIFLRPILIVVGLIASVSIFSALVLVMNDVFDLVVDNMTGFDTRYDPSGPGAAMDHFREPIDQLFFTVLYVALCYMLGNGCFKMVDQVPNNILRWMGVNVSTVRENEGNAAKLSGQMYKGTQITVGQISGAANQISGGRLAALLSK